VSADDRSSVDDEPSADAADRSPVSVDADATTAPRPVTLATTAVAAIGVAALALTATSAAPALGAVSGGLLALSLAYFDGDGTPPATVARGVALVTASATIGTLAVVAAQVPGAANVSLSLAGALWLAALGGVGAGRGTLSPTGLTGGAFTTFGAFVSFGVLIPVFGGSLLALVGVQFVLGWNAGTPAVGTVLALYGAASLLVGVALGSAPSSPDSRRPINRRIRRRAAGAKRLGRRLFGAAALVGFAGVLGGYELLGRLAPPLRGALVAATGHPVVRGVPLVVAGLAALAFVARRSAAWAWTDDGADATRITILLSAVAAVAMVALATVATAALLALPVPGIVSSEVVSDWSVLWTGLGAVLVASSVMLFGLRGVATASHRRAAVGPYACAGALLAGAVIAALRGPAVVAPLIGIGAAAVVWDVGRVGAMMGVELGDRATVERSALVRTGGSVAVGTLATVVAVAVAAGLRRLGPLVERAVGGPVVLAVGVAVALVAALALYARERSASPT